MLAAVIQAQAEEKEAFEQESTAKRQNFDEGMKENQAICQKQLTELETTYKERKDSLEKQRKREDEEYQYNLETTHRKESND